MFFLLLVQKIVSYKTQLMALRGCVEVRVLDLPSLNVRAWLGDLKPQCASQFDLKERQILSNGTCQLLSDSSRICGLKLPLIKEN
jgi:hypothetical protein